MARRAAPLLALGVVLACTGPARPPSPRPAVTATARPVEEPPEPAPDLSPVPEPKSLQLVARVQLDVLARLPLQGSLRSLARSPLAELFPELPPSLGELVTNAPAELAVAFDSPEQLLARGADWVWSLPLVSFEAALAQLRERERQDEVTLERRAPGVVALAPRGGARSTECLLSAAVGPAPARLICAERRASLDVLGAYAARGLPTRALGSEPLVIEATPARFARAERDKLAGLVRFIAPTPRGDTRWIDAALPVLATDAVDLLGDVGVARFSVSEEAGGLAAELRLDLDGQRSWFARTLGSMPPKTRSLTELFERLPASTEAAWYFTAAEASRSDEARAAFVSWLGAEVGTSVRRDTLELVAHTFIQRSPHFYAHGDAYEKDATHDRQTGRALWEKTRSTYGWHVLGFDEPARGFAPKLDRGMQAYNSGSLRDFAYRTLPRLCNGLGKIQKKPAPRELPAGSVLYQLALPGKFFDDCMKGRGGPPEPAPNDALVVVMMPVGERTLIGFGLQEREMIARMRGLARPSASLASGTELSLLEAPEVRLGGFFSLAGVGGVLRFATMREHWDWTRRSLTSLPNRGKTRAPFSVLVTRAGKPGMTRVVAKLELPNALLEDASKR